MPTISNLVYAALLYKDGDTPSEDFVQGTKAADSDNLIFSFQKPDNTSGTFTLEVFAFKEGTDAADFSRNSATFSKAKSGLTIMGDAINVGDIALEVNNLPDLTGTVSLQIKVPAGCMLAIDDTTHFDITDNAPNFTVTQNGTGIPVGTYSVTFTVKKVDETDNTKEEIIHIFTESINVLPGMRTDTWWNGAESSATKEITQGMISSTVYVRGVGGWYETSPYSGTATASDGNSGTYIAPLATIQKAVDKIIAINDGADEYTIYVDGTLKYDDSTYIGTNGMADFSALTENLTLTIKALSGTATLDGGAQFDADGNVTDAGIGKSVIYAAPASGTLNLTLDNLVITGGNTSKNGGGIYIGGGKFEMTGGKILKNISSRSGGGVYISKGTFDMEGGTISENTANQNGGGVYVATGTFSMKGGTISGNNAENGCGVYVDSGTFDMEGGTISGNNAPSYGGGVFVSNGTFTFTGGTISKCTARRGGGVSVYNGIFTMLGGTIGSETAGDANTASWGGGVYVEGGSTFTMTGGAISGNSATNDGNGAYLSATGTFNMSGSAKVAEDNDVYLSASGSNVATITVAGALSASTPVPIATITLPASSYTAGTPILTKGAGAPAITQGICDKFALSDEDWKIVPDGANGVLKTTTFYAASTGSDTTGDGTKTKPFATIQKALDTVRAMNDGTSAYTIYVDGTLQCDDSTYVGTNGMADFSALDKNLTLTIKALSGTATLDANQKSRVIYAKPSVTTIALNLTLENLVIMGGNVTGNGGGVCVYGGTFTMDGCTITGNTASANGGGVLVDNGTFTMNGGEISGNKTNYGGGVYIYGSSCSFTMNGGEISGNEIHNSAGGVYVNGGTFTMYGGTITDNTASSNGGGVFVNNGTFTMNDGTISDNTATNKGGGGVCLYAGTFTMYGGTISDNTATTNKGGGVFIDNGSTFKMSDGTITGNYASTNGGGVCVSSGTFTMEGGTITGNTAGTSKNGVYGTFTKTGGTVQTD